MWDVPSACSPHVPKTERKNLREIVLTTRRSRKKKEKKMRGTFLYVLYTPGEFYIRVISNGGSGIMSWGSAACMSYISTRGVLPLIFFYFVKVGKMLFYVMFVNWFLVRR